MQDDVKEKINQLLRNRIAVKNYLDMFFGYLYNSSYKNIVKIYPVYRVYVVQTGVFGSSPTFSHF